MQDTKLIKFFDKIDELGKKANSEWHYRPWLDLYIKDETELEFPMIIYSTSGRQPLEDQGRKPMRSRLKKEEKGFKETLSQPFQSLVQFRAVGRNYSKINNYRVWFEKFLTRHFKPLMENGIEKIFFQEQSSDEKLEIQNQTYLAQPLIYQIHFTYDFEDKQSEIGEIENKVVNIDDYRN